MRATDAKFTQNEHEEPSTDRSMARQSKDEQIQAGTEAADLQGKVRPKGKGKKENKILLPFRKDVNLAARVAGFYVRRLNTRVQARSF